MPTQIQPHLGLPAPTQWALKAGRGCHSWAPRSQAHPGVPLTSSISPYPSGTRVGSHGRPAGRSFRQSRAGRSGTDRAGPPLGFSVPARPGRYWDLSPGARPQPGRGERDFSTEMASPSAAAEPLRRAPLVPCQVNPRGETSSLCGYCSRGYGHRSRACPARPEARTHRVHMATDPRSVWRGASALF